MTHQTPWSHRVALQDVARGPVSLTLEADQRDLSAVAQELDLPAVGRLRGRATVSAWLDGLQVDATWSGSATQTCGVTLEPFDTEFSGAFQIRAVPTDSPAAAEPEAADLEIDLATPDPPDILQDDAVDVAALLVEHLALELDPFPRKPGATFEPPAAEPGLSPFAVLARLPGRSPDEG